MTDDQFTDLVARLEQSAQRDASAYRRRVVLLALLGYAYLVVMLVVLTALFLGSIASVAVLKGFAIKLIVASGAFLLLVLKAMWVRLDPPQGREVKRDEAPALFDAIEGLRRSLRAPRFHRILITDDFNAAVAQVPRLGMLGWHRNYLLIGLPLMKSLTVEQFRAVLAHEFGHLSAGHGRIGNWIYRLRISWARLMAVLEHRRSWGTFMFQRFFNWYVPYFAAYSFPLARANEYEADAVSARLTTSRAAAEALTSVNVVGSYLAERYWPDLHRHADDAPQPALAPYSIMSSHFAAGFGETATAAWLEQALKLRTGTGNTHPSLGDRLQAIGQAPHLVLPAAGESADTLLGESLSRITSDLDQQWLEGIRAAWEERYRKVQEGRSRLAELDSRWAAQGELDPAEAYERAQLTEAFGLGADAALEQFRALHARAPDHALYGFVLGQRLLARDDEAGFALIERAIAAEDQAIAPGCELLRDYCASKGRTEEARAWQARLTERLEIIERANAERSHVYRADKFEAHGLPPETVAALRERLLAIPRLRKAWLVRKQVTLFPQNPCYVLGFAVTPWWRLLDDQRAAEVQSAILEVADSDVIVLNVDGANSRFRRKMWGVRGARIL